jgi:RNA polymerase sigma-70 factor, ECF subfamily
MVYDMSDDSAVPDPDDALVARARAGDFTAFESLVTRYEDQVYRLALRMVRQSHDAEEVVQNTFLAALEHLADFRSDAPFRAWLMRIAANGALKLLRQKRTHPTASLDAAEEGVPHPEFIAPWQEEVADLVHRKEIRALLDQALAELDEKYRLVFMLRDMEELSTEETAQALQITPANVKVRLMRARLMLRERLTRVLGDAGHAATPHSHA